VAILRVDAETFGYREIFIGKDRTFHFSAAVIAKIGHGLNDAL
jgi:hypothetical protein